MMQTPSPLIWKTSLVKEVNNTRLESDPSPPKANWPQVSRVWGLCSYLLGVEEAWIVPRSSCLNICIQADVVLDLGELSYLIQVSSPSDQPQPSWERVNYQGRCYPSPGQLLVAEHSSLLQVLRDLSQLTRLPLLEPVEVAIEVATQLAGMKVPCKFIATDILLILLRLELVELKGSKVRFLDLKHQ